MSLASAGAAAAALALSAHSAPAEDAAMLMRYVQHLAAGHGIVWNTGEPPVDGATDLLPLVVAGAVAAFGATAETAVKLVALAAHVATALVVFWAARSRSAGLLLAAIVLFGPGWVYGNVGFVTPVFGLLATILVIAASRGLGASFAAAALLLTLTRPEGVFLTGLVAIVTWARDRRRVAYAPVVWWAACLAAFLVWRRWYFGDWIPSPYYAKGGFRLHLDGVVSSANYVGRFLWFAIVPAAIAWRRNDAARRAMIDAGIPVAGFAFLWTLLSGETNFAGRFQYAVLPMTAASLALTCHLWWPSTTAARAACIAVFGLAAVANATQYRPFAVQDGRVEVGKVLSRFVVRASNVQMPQPRTMAATEAGLLPFYSGWRTVDALGLNDADIARRRIDAARLDGERPDVLLVHWIFPLNHRPDSEALADRFTHAALVLFDYAHAHDYVLARAWGATAHDTHAYLVRPDAPDAATLVRAIREAPYACLVVTRGEVGLYGSVRRLVNFVSGIREPAPACLDWSYAAR